MTRRHIQTIRVVAGDGSQEDGKGGLSSADLRLTYTFFIIFFSRNVPKGSNLQ